MVRTSGQTAPKRSSKRESRLSWFILGNSTASFNGNRNKHS